LFIHQACQYVVNMNTSLCWATGMCQGSFLITLPSGELVLRLLQLPQNIFAINMTWHKTYLLLRCTYNTFMFDPNLTLFVLLPRSARQPIQDNSDGCSTRSVLITTFLIDLTQLTFAWSLNGRSLRYGTPIFAVGIRDALFI